MKKPILAALALVASLGLGLGAYTMMGGVAEETTLGSTVLPSAANAQTSGDAADIDTSRVIDMAAGNPESPVTLIEYSSFTCPHCARFNQTVYQQLRETYVDTGLINFVKREVYFDAYGLWAGMVARCAGPTRYFGIVEILFDEQSEWARGEDANAVANNLRRIGLRAGMTEEQLNTCLTDRDMATAMMAVYQQGVEDYGINSTPSFVINGTTYSNMSFEEFRAILDPLVQQ